MSRRNVFNLRLSDEELQALKVVAAARQVSPAEVVRDLIKPFVKKNKKTC